MCDRLTKSGFVHGPYTAGMSDPADRAAQPDPHVSDDGRTQRPPWMTREHAASVRAHLLMQTLLGGTRIPPLASSTWEVLLRVRPELAEFVPGKQRQHLLARTARRPLPAEALARLGAQPA